MKNTIYLIIAVMAVLLSTAESKAQAIYDANGQYLGYQATTPNGVTTTYTPSGQSVGSSQVDNGQRSYYSPADRYQGVATAPIYTAPNVTYTVPREVPQVRSIGGW